MFDPVTFVLIAAVLFAASAYARSRRRRARAREFDGGWHHDNDRHVTRILSPYITTVKGEKD